MGTAPINTATHRSTARQSSPRCIGVFRALQLGDMLCAVPALRALRGAYPRAHITLIGLPWGRTFVDRFSHYVDDFVAFPGWPGLPEQEPDTAAAPTFLTSARAREFDVVVQMHGDGRLTNGIVAMLGARSIVGACAEDAWRPGDGHFSAYPDGAPERRRALAALQPLGIAAAADQLEFPVFQEDRDALDGMREEIAPGVEMVVVHPGARARERQWPAVYFAAVADGLASQGYEVVITGTVDERDLADEVAASMRRRARVMAGETTLGALAALIEASRLVVCNDTGVSHLADALDVPSVVLFSGSDPSRWAPSDTRRHRAVCHPDTLDPQRVLAHAQGLLTRETIHAG